MGQDLLALASRQRFALTIVTSAAMAFLVLAPASTFVGTGVRTSGLIMHTFMFAAWTTAVLVDSPWLRERLGVMLVLGIAVALLSEAAQIPVPTRSFEGVDLVADLVGILTVVAVFYRELRPAVHGAPGHEPAKSTTK